MGISTTSRSYSDNFRYFRRWLQGRGVNLRETIVKSVSPYSAEERITVPGLHSDDRIISVLDLTDLDDVTGYLDLEGDKATVTIFSTNKGIIFTALKGGTEGNKIYVKSQAAPADSDGEDSQPLSVQIGAYDVLLSTTGHPGKTVILVNLATDADGAALSSSDNSAAAVLAAIVDAQEAMVGDAIVSVELAGSGATAWTATGPTALTGGTDFDKGSARASLMDDFADAGYLVARIKAQKPGADGNDITVQVAVGSISDVTKPTVAVTGTDILVTVDTGDGTTVQNFVDAINGDADASALVIAEVLKGSEDVAMESAYAQTPLAGGADPGIRLTVSSQAKALKVLWLTRDEIDENQ